LKWYALPAVADMLFDVGGIEFPAAPFNGWYMGTEIGSRNLLDENRYNLLPVIAEKMGLTQDSNTSLWKDRVSIETNAAVLHSFTKNGITIVDHHTASETFLTHMNNEMKSRGGCPADWVCFQHRKIMINVTINTISIGLDCPSHVILSYWGLSSRDGELPVETKL
jgi:nitric oxide synthase oxygenase domain/subunit